MRVSGHPTVFVESTGTRKTQHLPKTKNNAAVAEKNNLRVLAPRVICQPFRPPLTTEPQFPGWNRHGMASYGFWAFDRGFVLGSATVSKMNRMSASSGV